MKHTLLILLATVVTMVARAECTLEAAWGKALTAVDNSTTITNIVGNGEVVYLSGGGNVKTEQDYVSFGGETVAPGFEATSAASAYTLVQMDYDGNVKWSLHMKNGEEYANYGYAAVTPDGGVVVALNVRHAKQNGDLSPILVDAEGKEYDLDWHLGGNSRHYRIALMKVSSEGKIEWVRQTEVGEELELETGTTKHVEQGAQAGPVVVSKSGDIYVGGRFSMELTIPSSENDSIKVEPELVEGWNGTGTAGGMFVAKFGSDGYVKKFVKATGTGKETNVIDLNIDGEKLYVLGTVTFKEEGDVVALGSKSVEGVNANSSLTLAEMTLELDVEKYHYYPSTLAKSTFNKFSLVVGDEQVYIMGKAAYGVTIENGEGEDEDEVLSTGTLVRDGIIVKVDKASGKIVDGYAKGLPQSGYAGGFLKDGLLYCFSMKALPGEYSLETFSEEDLSEPISVEPIIKSVSDYSGVVLKETENGMRIVVAVRDNSEKNEVLGGAVEIMLPASKFSGEVVAIDLKTTGEVVIEDPTALEAVEVETTGAENDDVYTLTGRYAGKASELSRLPRGLYVSGGKIVSVK